MPSRDITEKTTARFSWPRVMWTSALGGGVLGTVLSESPILNSHQYVWYAVGSAAAVGILHTLLSRFGRRGTPAVGIAAGAMAGLVPGLVQWAMLPLRYNKVLLPQAVSQAQRALDVARKQPNVSPDQIQAIMARNDDWISFLKSPAGPWVLGGGTLILIVAWCALVATGVELYRVARGRYAAVEGEPTEP